jgi:DNA processing protein
MSQTQVNTATSTESPLWLSPADVLGELNDVEEKHAPKQLFYIGDRSLLERGPRVSVVGSRKATAEGLRRAQSLTKALVAHQIVVVSGLAEGIDTAAHTTAVAAGGLTIAVLGTPLDQFYPKGNHDLQQTLMREHLVVSQFPVGYAVTPKNFPIRNRTMALLTDATVIVEAGEKSSTVHQGWEALRLGRLLFLLESVANDPSLSWPKEMIHTGAQVLSRNNLEEVLSDIPAMTQRSQGDLAEYV